MICVAQGYQVEPQINLWNCFEGLICTVALLVLIPDVWGQCFNLPDSSFVGRTECTRVAKANVCGNWAFKQMWSHVLLFFLVLGSDLGYHITFSHHDSLGTFGLTVLQTFPVVGDPDNFEKYWLGISQNFPPLGFFMIQLELCCWERDHRGKVPCLSHHIKGIIVSSYPRGIHSKTTVNCTKP